MQVIIILNFDIIKLYSGSGRILVSRRVEGTLLVRVRLVMNPRGLRALGV